MGTFEFILGIIALTTLGTFLSNWQRAKHGYPITDDMGNVISRETGTQAQAHEARIEALEKRLAVLERIATDRGVQTADQIDALRQLDQLDRLDKARRARETNR
ncbi:hypothetical protein [Sphingomicrobium arenosum]|uniref:hypothetical protein n=1 Tax=Sphingomicrobium arenosum TaxID=2233861 RepID=UPI002240D48F|nr:hypothetical protein [Sphingomicrobium arenosum]